MGGLDGFGVALKNRVAAEQLTAVGAGAVTTCTRKDAGATRL